jgi:hypothetical protein
MNCLENSQERTIIHSGIGNSLKVDKMVRFKVRRQSQFSGFGKLTSRIKIMYKWNEIRFDCHEDYCGCFHHCASGLIGDD